MKVQEDTTVTWRGCTARALHPSIRTALLRGVNERQRAIAAEDRFGHRTASLTSLIGHHNCCPGDDQRHSLHYLAHRMVRADIDTEQLGTELVKEGPVPNATRNSLSEH